MKDSDIKKIEMSPIGFVRRVSPGEDDRDKSLVSRIVLTRDLAPALDGIEDWSHVYVIFWMDQVSRAGEPVLHFPGTEAESSPLGILATRAPIHPNPVGLTLVEIVGREENVLLVRGLDAYDGTPVLDIKPYPDWERGRFIVVADFRAPEWVTEITEGSAEGTGELDAGRQGRQETK
jgi:tRNA-Thr(GGU) m(6)t(6)A37 methyltransferase TsaA